MKIILRILPLFCCLMSQTVNAQSGCTDPQAINFDEMATENDGSCIYSTTSYALHQIGQLPNNLTECSGLAFFENRLWTHLDGGNLDQLFEVDTLNADQLSTVTIPNSTNKDWEDLAQDADHIYIGDFGNNQGNRTDLRIYKIKKSDLTSGTPFPELIEFSYSDQTDFTPVNNAHNFDCEAFFVWQDSIHLFSKNWLDFKTRHYVLPTTPGVHIAEVRDSLEVQMQVTAADITENGEILLLGYNVNSGDAFLWLLFDYQGNSFFSGNKRKIALGNPLLVSQPEGLVFRDETRGYICSEEFSILPAKLMEFDIRQWIENPTHTKETWDETLFSFAPNPVSNSLQVYLKNNKKEVIYLRIYDASGKVQLEKQLDKSFTDLTLQLNTSNLPTGNYWLLVQSGHKLKSAQFLKNE